MQAAEGVTSLRAGVLRPVLLAGLAGGLVDFVYGSGISAHEGHAVGRIWQSVAGGWIGSQAAQAGGMATVILGVATHFGIAVSMAAAFALAATRLPILYRRPLESGAVYGLLLYAVMNGVVLPLRWPQAFPSWDGAKSAVAVAVHVGVGIAIALTLARQAPRSESR